MGCACRNKNRERWQVVLPGGLKVTKSSEQAAKTLAAKSPPGTVVKKL